MGHIRQPIADPDRITAFRTISIYKAGATPDTPIAANPHSYKWQWIQRSKITTDLYLAAWSIGSKFGLYSPETPVHMPCTW